MANLFATPNLIFAGEGALELSEDTITSLGKKALIVTDNMMVKLGNVKKVTDILDNKSIEYTIYSEINSEPCDFMIEKGTEIYKNENCDFMIAVGGGSPIDSMKAIGAVVSNGSSINDFMGKKITTPLPPTVAVPTTNGTGSEATTFTIINNTEKNIKMLLSGSALMVNTAIIDPMFTMTAPPAITANTNLIMVLDKIFFSIARNLK